MDDMDPVIVSSLYGLELQITTKDSFEGALGDFSVLMDWREFECGFDATSNTGRRLVVLRE